MVIWLAPLVAIIGLLVYALSKNVEVKMLAIVAWGAGLLVTLMVFSNERFHLP